MITMTELLQRWGIWKQKLINDLAIPSETTIGEAMTGRLRYGHHHFPVSLIDIDRQIDALPAKPRRALYAEYVQGGTVGAKLSAAGMPRTTYYRALGRAHAALEWLVLEGAEG